jgi:hypothetical protein
MLLVALCALLACDDDGEDPAPVAPSVEPVETVEADEAPEPPEPVPLEEPEAAGRAAPLAPTIVERDGLHLTRLVTTATLEDRGPGEAQQVFVKAVDEKAYCYFVLENPEEEATRLTLSWVDEEGETANPPSIIEVPAQAHFESYRYTGLEHRSVGEYACLIQDDGREQLGRAPIRVEE